MIDSITNSVCLCYYVQNGLSYSGEETRPKLCIKWRQARSGVIDPKRKKHQLLHRIQSVRTFTNLQYLYPRKCQGYLFKFGSVPAWLVTLPLYSKQVLLNIITKNSNTRFELSLFKLNYIFFDTIFASRNASFSDCKLSWRKVDLHQFSLSFVC